MSKVGISNLHYALISTEDTAAANPVFGTVKKPTCGLVNVDVNVNTNKADLYADNMLWETESAWQSAELTASTADLPMDMQADLFGYEYDSTEKTLVKKASANKPYFALGFEFLMGNGSKMAVWLYKGRGSDPSMSGETKGESTNFGTNEITATFAGLKGTGNNTGRWMICKEFAANESTDSFFTAVPLAAN